MLAPQGWQRPALGLGAATLGGAFAATEIAGGEESVLSSRGAIGAVGGAAAAGAALLAHRARTVTIVTQLAEQADLTAVRAMTRGPERRAAAWDALQGVAERSQAPVLAHMDALESSGVVRSQRSLALGNSIIARVPARHASAFEHEMAKVPGVAGVYRDFDPGLGRRAGMVLEDSLLKTIDRIGRVSARARRSPPAGTGANLELTGSLELQRRGATGQGVTVGVLDSGIDASHPALRGAYRGTDAGHDHAWFDPISGRQAPFDPFGHGTHVAGTVVGRTPDFVIGAAPDADLIVARVLRSNTPHAVPQLRALEWMLAPTDLAGAHADPRRGADVVSGSIYTAGTKLEPVYATAIDQLADAGITSVFAAGNNGLEAQLGVPARLPRVLTVAATDMSDRLASFSSRTKVAPSGAGPQRSQPDIAAPGVGIVSSVPWGGLKAANGTSMSTPLTSGIAAQLLGRHPGLAPDTLRETLVRSARDVGTPGFDAATGAGRIDALAADAIAPAVLAESRSTAQMTA